MKSIHEMIEVMQAFDRGEVIQQYRLHTPQALLTELSKETLPAAVFNWASYDYCIKPRPPKVIFVNEYVSGQHAAYETAEDARERAKSGALRSAVKYQEMVQ